MKRLSWDVMVFILLAVLLVPSNIFSCGMMIETRFVSKHFPDAPRQPYAAGKLGILWPGFERRYLVIAYRYLDNKPLAAAETKSLTDPMQPRVIAPGMPYDADPPVTLWLKTRSEALGFKEVQKIDIQRYKVNGFEQYPNCGDDAFVTAAATATSRAETFGVGSPPMREWIAGQDAVFQNCGSAQDLRWYGPDQKRPEAVFHQPAPIRLSNALLKLDRQYQVAAANFYGGNFEAAAADFEAIARDQESPWHKQARYLVARCYIRKATLDTTGDERFAPEPMSLAETRLKAMLADKSLADIHPAAQSLLDYVEARLHPEQRTHAIAKRLESGAGDEFEKKLFDYTYLLDHILEQGDSPEVKEQVKHYSGPATNEQMQGAAQVDSWRSEARKSGRLDDLTDWVLTFQVDSQLSSEYRFQRWQASKSLPWLISALVAVQPGDPHANELTQAAAAIAPESSAYDTALYNRVRLLLAENKNEQARTLLDANMQRIDKLAPSDQNAFLAQRFSVAANFQEFLHFAPRTPVEIADNVGKHSYVCTDGSCSTGSGPPIKPPPRLQLDSVNIFNQRMPLTLLVQAANGTLLPVELRNELAARTWLRAALLDDTAVAHELEPHVAAAYPEMRSYLEQYDRADSPSARRFAVVFMVMHFPGMQPFVNSGPMGSAIMPGINSYISWWCYDVGEAQEHRPQQSAFWSEAGTGVPPAVTVGDVEPPMTGPAWVSPAALAQAEKERAKISAIGAAPLYFAPAVLDWAEAHPDDPRVPEALHYFVRATRYGCVDKSIGPYSRRAFDLLHKKYPQSEWAKKTPYWFG